MIKCGWNGLMHNLDIYIYILLSFFEQLGLCNSVVKSIIYFFESVTASVFTRYYKS